MLSIFYILVSVSGMSSGYFLSSYLKDRNKKHLIYVIFGGILSLAMILFGALW